jgi:hypothetical protein
MLEQQLEKKRTIFLGNTRRGALAESLTCGAFLCRRFASASILFIARTSQFFLMPSSHDDCLQDSYGYLKKNTSKQMNNI